MKQCAAREFPAAERAGRSAECLHDRAPSRAGVWLTHRSIAALLVSLACAAPQPAASPDAEANEQAGQTVAPLVRSAERSRESGDFDTAIQGYADAFARTPWNTKLKRALAVTHTERAADAREKGSLERAERDMRAALELYPEDPEFRHSLAVVLLERSAIEMDGARATAYRDEVRRLDPGLAIPDGMPNPAVERRMDLAFELLDRGQLDAGIGELELIQRDFPREPTSARLLAQALVRRATQLTERENFTGARESLDRAVDLYGLITPCDGVRCTADELRIAHYNRVVTNIAEGRRAEARTALEEAQQQGLRFPDLAESLAR
jgi:tetratricopeptide (TPR) repeat protein